jgi:hypothetical protein
MKEVNLLIVNQKSKRALKGFVEYTLSKYRKLFVITAVILIMLTLENVIYTISSYFKFTKASSDIPYVGMSIGTTYGYFIVMGLLSIYMFFTATKKNVSRGLRLPLSREVFAVGNFVNLVTCTLILLVMLLVMILMEGIFGNVLSACSNYVLLVNEMTLQNFITGLWISVSYMVLAASVAYCLGIYFFRYTIFMIIMLTILVSLICLFLPSANFLFGESSVAIFSVKVWVLIIATHVVSYLPLRKMEVTLS